MSKTKPKTKRRKVSKKLDNLKIDKLWRQPIESAYTLKALPDSKRQLPDDRWAVMIR